VHSTGTNLSMSSFSKLEIEWKILNCESERADYASVREQDHQHTAMR
jgi:hypothetical protein